MQACSHCGEAMADAAARCPKCGVPVGGSLSEVRDIRDEPIGFERDQPVLMIILALLGLLALAGIVWFVR